MQWAAESDRRDGVLSRFLRFFPVHIEPALAKRILIDNRTDVYSLGATLFETVTLEPMLSGADRQELLKQIAFEEPISLRKIDPRIPSELAIIIAKAVEKNPDDRYQTAGEMAEDLNRFLSNQVIKARRPTLVQRAAKWSSRHRGFLVGVAIVLTLLTIGLSIGSFVLDRERRRADGLAESERHQKNVADQEKLKAQKERDNARKAQRRAEQIKEFIVETLGSPDPAQDGRSVLVIDVLEKAEKEVEVLFSDEPELQADLFQVLGPTYRKLGLPAESVRLLRRTVSIRKQHLGPEHPETLDSMNSLSAALLEEGDYAAAFEFVRHSFELRKRILGPENPDTLLSMGNLGVCYVELDELNKGIDLLKQALELKKRILGANNLGTLKTLQSLATAHSRTQQYGESEALLKKLCEFYNGSLGNEHPDTLRAMDSLGAAHNGLRQYDEGLKLHKEVLPASQRVFGPEHPFTLGVMCNLATTYVNLGRLDKSLPLYEEALRLKTKVLGRDDKRTIYSMDLLAKAYSQVGRHEDAIRLHSESLQLQKIASGSEHAKTLKLMNWVVQTHVNASRYEAAIRLGNQSVNLHKKVHGLRHLGTLESKMYLAHAIEKSGDVQKALSMTRPAYELYVEILGQEHPETIRALSMLARRCRLTGDFDKSTAHYEEIYEYKRKALGDDHVDTLAEGANLGLNYILAGDREKAQPLLEAAVPRVPHSEFTWIRSRLGGLYYESQQYNLSIPLFKTVYQHSLRKLGAQHPTTLRDAANLGAAYMRAGQMEKALPLLEEVAKHVTHAATLGDIRKELIRCYSKANLETECFQQFDLMLKESKPSQKAGILAQMALAQLHFGAFDGAAATAKECLVIREKELPESWLYFNTKCLLGRALLGQRKYEEAEKELLIGVKGMRDRKAAIPQAGKARLTEAIRGLIRLYLETDQPDEVAKWKAIFEEEKANKNPE